MRFRAVAGILLRQFYLMRGSPSRLLPVFAWVSVDMVLWGFIARYLSGAGGATLDLVPQLLGGMLLWNFFARIMHGVATAFLEDLWSRNFVNVFAAPLGMVEYLLGLVSISIASSLVSLMAMTAVAAGLFGLSPAVQGSSLVPLLLILLLSGMALGILASAIVLRHGTASEWLVWPMPALLLPFSGVFYPLATLPPWMQVVAQLLPPTQVFEAMRAMQAGRPVAQDMLWIAGMLAALQLVLAIQTFRHVFHHSLASGLLVRHGAQGGG